MINSYSPKEKSRELGQNHHSLDLLMYGELEQTSSVLERFSLATVVIKMWRVIEIKFRGRRPTTSTHFQQPIGSSVLVQKPEIFLHKLMRSVYDWHSFYELSARDIGLTIEMGR